jgi:hypothetical protein
MANAIIIEGMNKIGIIEGFFGPAWSSQGRQHLAEFMQTHRMGYYIYAPKSDPHLRKAWRAEWSEEYLIGLQRLSQVFRRRSIRFGVGISPFGIGANLKEDLQILRQKALLLASLDIDMLGVFFDDMKWEENSLAHQLQALEVIRSSCGSQILFCPTFYSEDPVLDKVFGQRPSDDLKQLGLTIPPDIDILWTGPKVISPEIPAAHLEQVSEILGRSPVVWDNFFANDGPKQCRFLKLKALTGRSQAAFGRAKAWAFNPMNQIFLSQVVVLSAQGVLEQQLSPEAAFVGALHQLCPPDLTNLIAEHSGHFLNEGLDKMPQQLKFDLAGQLASFSHPAAEELRAWLDGAYLVGSECLTD